MMVDVYDVNKSLGVKKPNYLLAFSVLGLFLFIGFLVGYNLGSGSCEDICVGFVEDLRFDVQYNLDGGLIVVPIIKEDLSNFEKNVLKKLVN